MDSEQKAAEEARRERHWDPAVRWRVLQDTITWAEAQGTVDRNAKSARLQEQRRKLAWLEEYRNATERADCELTEGGEAACVNKPALRSWAHANRRGQKNKEQLSRQIFARLRSLPEYRAARTVMFYVDVRDEVRTRTDLVDALAAGKKVVVPYCLAGELELFRLDDMEELGPGMLGILEPKSELREVASKRVNVTELDLIIVPGVAFDRQGGRTGHGKGYYDKLLVHAKPGTTLVAVAFECQLFPEVPMDDHDVFMDLVVTEADVYRTGRRTTP